MGRIRLLFIAAACALVFGDALATSHDSGLFGGLFDGLAEAIQGFVVASIQFFADIFTGLLEVLYFLVELLWGFAIKRPLEFILVLFLDAYHVAYNFLGGLLFSAWDYARDVWASVIIWFRRLWDVGLDFMAHIFGELGLESLWTGLTGAWEFALNWFDALIADPLGVLGDAFSAAWEWVLEWGIWLLLGFLTGGFGWAARIGIPILWRLLQGFLRSGWFASALAALGGLLAGAGSALLGTSFGTVARSLGRAFIGVVIGWLVLVALVSYISSWGLSALTGDAATFQTRLASGIDASVGAVVGTAADVNAISGSITWGRWVVGWIAFGFHLFSVVEVITFLAGGALIKYYSKRLQYVVNLN